MINKFTTSALYFDVLNINETWNSQNNCSSFWRLYLNKTSTASVICGDSKHRISTGHFHLIPAWTQFSCMNTGVTEHFYIHFNIIGIPGILIRKYWPLPIELPSRISYSKVVSRFTAKGNDRFLVRQAMVNEWIYSALTELFEIMPEHDIKELEHLLAGHSRFAALTEHIESCLSGPLLNAHLARKCYMSEGHFVRSFTNTFGQSPAKYVLERRIAKASELLRYTDMPIDTITIECGFSNRFHFSRVFKKLIGQSPAAYRTQCLI